MANTSTQHVIVEDADTVIELKWQQLPQSGTSSQTNTAHVNGTEQTLVRYFVSSNQLILASRNWRNSLTGEWRESNRNADDGLFHLTGDDDWDYEAFQILLNILHLKSKDVPNSVTLDMLTKFAVIVDHYQCQDAVHFYVEVWAQHLFKISCMPTKYEEDLIKWLCVVSVFHLPQQLLCVTRSAMLAVSDQIDMLGLPIRDSIIEMIQSRRDRAMTRLADGINELRRKFRDPNYICSRMPAASFPCGSMLLGSLTKAVYAKELTKRDGSARLTEISLGETLQRCRLLQDIQWYGMTPVFMPHPCKISHFLTPVVENVESGLRGIEPEDLPSRSRDIL